MPRGVYPRTEKQLEQAKINLAKGRTKEVQLKAKEKLIKLGADPEWRKKVSEATKKAMHRKDVREKHLKGLKKAREKYGVNYKGGNGQEPTEIIKTIKTIFVQNGLKIEYPVKTKKIKNKFLNVPDVYKIDFAYPKLKIAIEVDGVSHRNLVQKEKDNKKTKALQSLGWTVIRLKH